jgi:hypothetical protein
VVFWVNEQTASRLFSLHLNDQMKDQNALAIFVWTIPIFHFSGWIGWYYQVVMYFWKRACHECDHRGGSEFHAQFGRI